MELLFKNIRAKIKLPDEAKGFLNGTSTERMVNKNEILIKEGKAVNHVYFVLSGCFRAYMIDKTGKQHTLQFAIRDWWISDWNAVFMGENAKLTVEAIVDSNVVEFKHDQLMEIYRRFPEFESYQRKNLERHVVSLNERILGLLQLPAIERYNLFLQTYPGVYQIAKDSHIASFLGITPQSLSRLKTGE